MSYSKFVEFFYNLDLDTRAKKQENRKLTLRKYSNLSITYRTGSYCYEMFVCRLLKETSCQLESGDQEEKRPKWLRQLEAGQKVGQEIDDFADEKRMLSRYGIWMLAGLCTPNEEAPSVGFSKFA